MAWSTDLSKLPSNVSKVGPEPNSQKLLGTRWQQWPGFLRMPAFTCGACGHPQRGGSRYKVTADNLGGVRALMTASGRAGLAALLAVGMVLCTISRSVNQTDSVL